MCSPIQLDFPANQTQDQFTKKILNLMKKVQLHKLHINLMILVRIRSQTPAMLKVLIILSNHQLRFCDIYHMVSKFVYIPLSAFLLSRPEVPKTPQ